MLDQSISCCCQEVVVKFAFRCTIFSKLVSMPCIVIVMLNIEVLIRQIVCIRQLASEKPYSVLYVADVFPPVCISLQQLWQLQISSDMLVV